MDLQEKQNQPEMIALLRARRVLGGRIKNVQGIFLLLSVGLAVAGFAMSFGTERTRASVALLGVALALIDAFWFDPWQKKQTLITAKLQEQFDCAVLDIPWNGFAVGARVDPEDVQSLAARPLRPKTEGELRGWYAAATAVLPAPMAALVCQRSNLWYDGKQRGRYLIGLQIALSLVVVAFVLALVGAGASAASAVLYAAPLMPFLTWGAKEIVRQKATIETVRHLKEEIERLWGHLIQEVATRPGLGLRVRELQDAIYNHRANSPLIFDWVYSLLRRELDASMGSGAEVWAKELKSALGESA